MHDPQFGLGMDTRVHLWHPCKVEVREVNHNGVDWVDISFLRHLDLPDGAWSTEQVVMQVRQEVARDLLLRLLDLFPGTFTVTNVYIREREGPCQDATVEES